LCLAYYFARDIAHRGTFLEHNVYSWHVWYCAAEIVSRHRDPYLVEPLRACEHRLATIGFQSWAVAPFPLPGYTLALMWPLLKLPFFVGKLAWIGIVFAALCISAWSLSRLTGLWFSTVLLIFAPTIGLLNVEYGGLEPVGIAALCLAAVAFERNRASIGGALTVVAMIEPHLGLPAVVAVFLLIPRARLAIVAGGIVLALASVAVLGWPTVVEYVRVILPAQSGGEAVMSVYQYSLTHVLHVLGAPAKVATTAGSIWYLGTIALGTFAAARIRARYGRASAIALVPVAISLFGGLYVHNHQITAALPGALLLATLPLRGRWLAIAAVALLAFPWQFDTRSQEAAAACGVCAAVFALTPKLPAAIRLATAALASEAFFLFRLLPRVLPHHRFPHAGPPPFIGPSELATVAWTKYLIWFPGRTTESAATLVTKIPWWLALFALTLVTLSVVFERTGARGGSPARS
jgi:hypothetical protein